MKKILITFLAMCLISYTYSQKTTRASSKASANKATKESFGNKRKTKEHHKKSKSDLGKRNKRKKRIYSSLDMPSAIPLSDYYVFPRFEYYEERKDLS